MNRVEVDILSLARYEKLLLEIPRLCGGGRGRLRRTLIYSLWLGLQLCPDQLNDILHTVFLSAMWPSAAGRHRRSLAAIVRTKSAALSLLNGSAIKQIVGWLRVSRDDGGTLAETVRVSRGSQRAFAVATCILDGNRLERTRKGHLTLPHTERYITTQAKVFAGSDCHLSFYNKVTTSLLKAARRYVYRRLFESFLRGFLAALRTVSVPSWPTMPSSIPMARSRDGIADHVKSIVKRRVPGVIVHLSRRSLVGMSRNDSICGVLQEFVTNGFVLHGSPVSIKDVLMPARGNCLTGKREGNVTAVYFTKDPQVAVFRATRKKANLFNCWDSVEKLTVSQTIFGGAEGLGLYSGHSGYVYLVPRIGEGNSRFRDKLSQRRCQPWFRIPVVPSDFSSRIHIIPDYEISYNWIIGRHWHRMLSLASVR